MKETEEELATTKRTLDETRAESAAMKVSFEKVISDLEEELYDETIQKERLLKVKAELEAEVASLRWYFQPLGTYSQRVAHHRSGHNVLFLTRCRCR